MPQGYYWVVTCRKAALHREQNPFGGHRIPLGRTDGTAERPPLPDQLKVMCDDAACRKSYSYECDEVIRWRGDVPTFIPHPAFE
jgi:hypothetical protein